MKEGNGRAKESRPQPARKGQKMGRVVCWQGGVRERETQEKKLRVKKTHNKWMQEHNEGRKGKYLWGKQRSKKGSGTREKKKLITAPENDCVDYIIKQ